MGEFKQMFKFFISVMQTVDGVNEQRMGNKRPMIGLNDDF